MSDACANPDCGHPKMRHIGYCPTDPQVCEDCPCTGFVTDDDQQAALCATFGCGHTYEEHWSGTRVCANCPCPAFVADVNRPADETCAECEAAHGPASCGDVDCWHRCPAASDRGAGELADILADELAKRLDVLDEINRTGSTAPVVKVIHLGRELAAVLIAAGWEKR